MKRENFYRRDPGAALAGMATMSLEERGVYNTIIDLMYLTWRPLEDNPAYIAGHCGCAVQKLNPILRRLIERGKLIRFEEGGQIYISNPAFERERLAVKGEGKTRSGRAGVEEKSGEVGEKSTGVEKNPPVCEGGSDEKQPVTPLDKSREDKTRHLDANASSSPKSDKPPDEFVSAWKAYPHVKGRSSRQEALKHWRKLTVVERAALPGAVARYGRHGREPKMECGAPAMDRWIRDRRFEDWLEETPSVAVVATDPWEPRVREFRQNRFWNDLDWGAKPGRPDCKAPADVLRRHGFEPQQQEAPSLFTKHDRSAA